MLIYLIFTCIELKECVASYLRNYKIESEVMWGTKVLEKITNNLDNCLPFCIIEGVACRKIHFM